MISPFDLIAELCTKMNPNYWIKLYKKTSEKVNLIIQ